MQHIPQQQIYDPWEIKQEITDFNIEIHCCRYWMLSEWECENLSLPSWRIYHSRTGGSFVQFGGETYELTNDKLILIPPYTAFSSCIHQQYKKNERIKGIKITGEAEVAHYAAKGMSDQFFAHFNLGHPYDKISPGVYICSLNDHWHREMQAIETERIINPNTINMFSSMKINGLLIYALEQLQPETWNLSMPDKRIALIIRYIDENINTELHNAVLSDKASMATNSFARLFRNLMQQTVQQYIQQKRIEKAIKLLHYSSLGIEDIAVACGYYDRHHFSKVFKFQTGFSPVRYRKRISGEFLTALNSINNNC